MNPVGIVRNIDQLGRIVLPKSLRTNFNMDVGTPIEILVKDDHIILERHTAKCVFCFSGKNVKEYKEKTICDNCMDELVKL